MYNVLDISRYVINYSNDKGYGISNLKLQKILYFIQAFFLTKTAKRVPCFYQRIEAWDFGPVIPEAYREYKQYGSSNIPTIRSFIKFDQENIWDIQRINYNSNVIADEDKAMINLVVDKFSEYSATDLVELTHNQAPWSNAYVPYKNNEITIEDIREYFNE